MAEIRHILCPVDFSEISSHALEHAFAFARWYRGRVTVLHVSSVPLPLMAVSGIPSGASAFPRLPPEDMTAELRRFVESTNGADPRVTDLAVVEGSAVREILNRANQATVDLLVMGTHGHSGFESLFLGSVTEKVLRSTHVPVLTVAPAIDRGKSVVYKTILCPIEFSDASTRALEYALTLAKETDARLLLLHVVEPHGDVPEPGELSMTVEQYRDALEDEAHARLRSAVPTEARVWCTPEERVASGKAYRVILDRAEQEKAEIIVMGVHGKGVLNRRLFGSTTHHVIRGARCPVLTLRS